MTVRYHQCSKQIRPIYLCQNLSIQTAKPACQTISGASLDEAVGRLLIDTVTPIALELALKVQQELESRRVEHDAMRRQEVEHARYECDIARRRYMQVDPDNRLVADSLEAEWNEKLRAHEQARQRYEKHSDAEAAGIDEKQRASIINLAKDFPRLWNDPRTPDRERKRMARLLITDVTLLKGTDITAQIRFNGGTTHTLHLELPKPAWQIRQTPTAVVAQVDRLLEEYTDTQVARQLNAMGMRSGEGHTFSRAIVRNIRTRHHLQSRYDRLRSKGLLTLKEIAERLDVQPGTIKIWRRAGLLPAHCFGGRGEYLFEPPGAQSPVKYQYQREIQAVARASKASSNRSDK